MAAPELYIVNSQGGRDAPKVYAKNSEEPTDATVQQVVLEGGGGPPHDGAMEARVAKLEVTTEYIQRDVAEIKSDLKITNQAIRDFSTLVNSEFRKVDDEFKKVRDEAKADLHKIFAALVFVAVGLAGLMAKGFGWFS